MARIFISNTFTKQRREIIRRAANISLEKWFHPKTRRSICSISIIPIRYNTDADGFCSPRDPEVRPKWYLIEIQPSLIIKDLHLTVFHEMAHVRQYATGKLYYRKTGMVRFEKNLYSENHQYEKCPWEIEARQAEAELAKYW